MTKATVFLGTRLPDGTMGPHLDDEQITQLFRLYPDKKSSGHYLFPDLSLMIHHINGQIQGEIRTQQEQTRRMLIAQQVQQLERELAEEYEIIFDQWNCASSLENEEKKDQQWDKVVDMARPILIHLREAWPKTKPVAEWDDALAGTIEQTGRMYIEVLLFIICARAAYEPESLGRDPTLQKYCQQLKKLVSAHLEENNADHLMLSAAFDSSRTSEYNTLHILNGNRGPLNPDACLAAYVRKVTPQRLQEDNQLWSMYNHYAVEDSRREVISTRYPDRHWHIVTILWGIYSRVEQLEKLLAALIEHGSKVDFRCTDEVREQMEQLMIESSDISRSGGLTI